jgi:hypothetical protein
LSRLTAVDRVVYPLRGGSVEVRAETGRRRGGDGTRSVEPERIDIIVVVADRDLSITSCWRYVPEQHVDRRGPTCVGTTLRFDGSKVEGEGKIPVARRNGGTLTIFTGKGSGSRNCGERYETTGGRGFATGAEVGARHATSESKGHGTYLAGPGFVSVSAGASGVRGTIRMSARFGYA